MVKLPKNIKRTVFQDALWCQCIYLYTEQKCFWRCSRQLHIPKQLFGMSFETTHIIVRFGYRLCIYWNPYNELRSSTKSLMNRLVFNVLGTSSWLLHLTEIKPYAVLKRSSLTETLPGTSSCVDKTTFHKTLASTKNRWFTCRIHPVLTPKLPMHCHNTYRFTKS